MNCVCYCFVSNKTLQRYKMFLEKARKGEKKYSVFKGQLGVGSDTSIGRRSSNTGHLTFDLRLLTLDF